LKVSFGESNDYNGSNVQMVLMDWWTTKLPEDSLLKRFAVPSDANLKLGTVHEVDHSASSSAEPLAGVPDDYQCQLSMRYMEWNDPSGFSSPKVDGILPFVLSRQEYYAFCCKVRSLYGQAPSTPEGEKRKRIACINYAQLKPACSWLRTSGYTPNSVSIEAKNGTVSTWPYYDGAAVRPAVWLDAEGLDQRRRRQP
jgi:hypothetical protein